MSSKEVFDPLNDEDEVILPEEKSLEESNVTEEVKEEIEPVIQIDNSANKEQIESVTELTNDPKHKGKPPLGLLTGNMDVKDIAKSFQSLLEFLNDKDTKSKIDNDPNLKWLKENIQYIRNLQYEIPLYYLFNNNEFREQLNNGNFDQIIKDASNKDINSITHPKPKKESKGNNAVAFIANKTGTGKITRIKLYNSGLVLDLKPFTSTELLNLAMMITDEKYTLGMETRGVIYSSDDAYMVDIIADSILQHVFDCNLVNWNIDKIKELLNPLDIQALFTGALKSIYPDGYPIFYTCINYTDEENKDEHKLNCKFTINAKKSEDGEFEATSLINFGALLRVDKSKLDMSHLMHLSGKEKKTEEEIVSYQESLKVKNNTNTRILIYDYNGHKAYANLRIPSFVKHSLMCLKWIATINKLVDDAIKIHSDLSVDDRRTRRLSYINQHSQNLEGIKQLSWIENIEAVDDDESLFITDEETIEKVLAQYTSNIEDTKVLLEKGIQTFKEQSTISIAGLPNFSCPECGDAQIKDGNYPSLIPLNMISYFFILMVHSVLKA